MKVNGLFFIFFAMCFAISCKKEKMTYVEGIVINIGSKQTIDSVLVSMHDGLFGSGNTINTYTDQNGHFKISIVADAPFLWLSKKGYRFVQVAPWGTKSTDPKSYQSGSSNPNQTFELWAAAYFDPIFKGLKCLPTDSVLISDGKYLPRGYGSPFLFHGNGPWGPLPAGWLGIGDEYFPYWVEYQIKGVWKVKIDSVYIKSFTTYKDTIYF